MKKSDLREFLLYFIVGGIATVTEWILFFLLDKVAVHYTLATIIAYALSTFVNWLSGRILVFKESRQPFWKEISEVYLAALVGLLLNLLIMWVAVDLIDLQEMISKIAATAIVFSYSFLVRKLLIYKS